MLFLDRAIDKYLTSDKVTVVDPGLTDFPNVIVDETNRGVRICASSRWNRLRNLVGLFVGIMSHESIHLALLEIDGNASDRLDNIASLSTLTRSLNDIGLVSRYPDGMIGLDRLSRKN